MRLFRRAALLGLDSRQVNCTHLALLLTLQSDAPDFYNSTILDTDPDSGFGGWGDSANDYRVMTGAFGKDFVRAYPAPHNIRRNFTLQPFLGQSIPTGVAPFDTSIMINTTFTKEIVDYLVNSFVGDYRGFHAFFEGMTVCSFSSSA